MAASRRPSCSSCPWYSACRACGATDSEWLGTRHVFTTDHDEVPMEQVAFLDLKMSCSDSFPGQIRLLTIAGYLAFPACPHQQAKIPGTGGCALASVLDISHTLRKATSGIWLCQPHLLVGSRLPITGGSLFPGSCTMKAKAGKYTHTDVMVTIK